MTLSLLWSIVLRVLVGVYWLYFGFEKLRGYGWVRSLLQNAAFNNPIPLYNDFLRSVVLPNWELVTIFQTILEIAVGVGLVLGLLTRICAALGVFAAVNLTLTFAFSVADFGLVFWFYSLGVLVNSTALAQNSGQTIGIDRLLSRSPWRHK